MKKWTATYVEVLLPERRPVKTVGRITIKVGDNWHELNEKETYNYCEMRRSK